MRTYKMPRAHALLRPLALFVVTAAGVHCASSKDKDKDNGTDVNPAAPGLTCSASLDVRPEGSPWAPAPDVTLPVATSFTVTVDPQHPVLAGEWREPHSEPLTFAGGTATMHLTGGVKRFAKHPERLFFELYLVSDDPLGIADVQAAIDGLPKGAVYYDLSDDPLAAPSAPAPLLVGGIGPRGVSSHIRFGLDVAKDATSFSFNLRPAGTTTTRVSTASAPIAVTPDGREVWAPVPDADTVAVIDAARDARTAQIAVPGRPSSVATTPDGALVLVTCAACNQLTVIDRASRAVVQRFGEADGIGRDPRNVGLSPDGARAYVSAYVGDSVTALERVGDRFRVVKTLPVGRRPVGISVVPDGGTLYVAHFMPHGPITDNAGWVSVVSTDTLVESATAELRDDANVRESECIRGIEGFKTYSAESLSFEAVPTQLAGVFLTPGGAEGWVPGLRTAGFPIFEGNTAAVGIAALVKGANSPAFQFLFDARRPRRAQFPKSSAVVDITDRSEEFLSCVTATEESEGVTATRTSDTERAYLGATVPSGGILLSALGVSRFVGYSRGGRRAMLVSYNADEIAVFDGATHHPVALGNLLLKGSNPVGLASAPDGKKAYVAYENSTFVSVLDLSAYAEDARLPSPSTVPYRLPPGDPAQNASLITFVTLTRNVTGLPDAPPIREVAQVPLLDRDVMEPVMRRGKVLFTSSSPVKYPGLSATSEASCSACHPNGGNDGSAWSTMEGERRTIGLWGGTGKRGWLHASGTHASAHDFATTIVKERLGGRGLSEEDVAALSLYVAKGIPEVQRPVVDAALASRGAGIFRARCINCHSGADHGSGNVDPNSPIGAGAVSGPELFDIGSATTSAHVGLGQGFSHLFPPKTKKVFDLLRGDRALGPGDEVQVTLEFTSRPTRPRTAFKGPALVNTWENAVFFHDARSSSLEEAIRDMARRVGLPLPDDDFASVVAYMKTL